MFILTCVLLSCAALSTSSLPFKFFANHTVMFKKARYILTGQKMPLNPNQPTQCRQNNFVYVDSAAIFVVAVDGVRDTVLGW